MKAPNDWDDLPKWTKAIQEGKVDPIRWSCGQSKRIQMGDRVFFIRLGKKPRGLFASGLVAKSAYEDKHWDSDKARKGATSYFVKVTLDALLDPNSEDQILPRKLLNESPYSEMHWDTQMSGVLIPDKIAGEIENLWSNFISAKNFSFPEEIAETQEEFVEGAARQVFVNAYERNPEARRICIEHFGASCQVCNFDFESKYGKIGRGYIHVHHLKQISEIRKEYKVNPIKDLRPVCPNCHAIIHKRKPPFTIEEVKNFLKT